MKSDPMPVQAKTRSVMTAPPMMAPTSKATMVAMGIIAFRNAMIPIATIVAFDVGAIIGGAVITERVFAWTGMGSLFINGLERVDPNPVMAFFLVTGALAIFFNLVADLAYAALDP